MWVTFIRDGMNLVSYEFLASQKAANPGVLVLSEFAGSAESLSDSSIIINPVDISNSAVAIKQVCLYRIHLCSCVETNPVCQALEMDTKKRREYLKKANRYLKSHTVQNWATQFLNEMQVSSLTPTTEALSST